MLRRNREQLGEQWARGNFHSDKPLETQIMNEGALAELRVIDRYLNMTYDQVKEGLEDEREGE